MQLHLPSQPRIHRPSRSDVMGALDWHAMAGLPRRALHPWWPEDSRAQYLASVSQARDVDPRIVALRCIRRWRDEARRAGRALLFPALQHFAHSTSADTVTPIDIYGALALAWWLADAADITLGTGVNVTAWTTHAGPSVTLSQGTESEQPDWNAAGLDSRGQVEFDGVSELIETAQVFDFGDEGAFDHPVITWVGNNPDADQSGRWLALWSGPPGGWVSGLHLQDYNSPNERWRASWDVGATESADDPVNMTTAPHLLEMRTRASSLDAELVINGTQIGTANTNGAGLDHPDAGRTFDVLTLAGAGNGGVVVAMNASEILVLSSPGSAQQDADNRTRAGLYWPTLGI